MPTKSGVFISYSRTDGSDYAAWLREKLQKQHREIFLWQDIISERAGRDWWQQITDALDHVAYMVLVATPACLASETVRKEWRYARQQGVCVLPVRASNNIDFDSFPRWMHTKHFADLKVKAQWNLFIGDLHRPHEIPRVPFMAEDMPTDFVARPEQFEPLIQMLLDTGRERQENPVAITTALQGAGGFGKTTLAKAICHDGRIQQAFDDGTLWITLGEDLSPDRLKGKVKDLIAVLSGEDTDFDSMEAAATRLRALLADRSILVVIDDVWNPADLNPFLQGGKFCARLITTRHLDTLPRQCRDVKVDSMQPDEAADLLGKGLPPDCKSQLDALAERVGYWPLLLGIVNGHLRERVDRTSQPLSQAIAYVSRALAESGLTALDPENAAARNLAVALTVDVSLKHFSQDERDRRRFEELSIFPEDVDIPLSLVEKLWSGTGDLKPHKVEDLCVKLNRHSLLQTLNLETRHLRLHDVMRKFLQTALATRTDPKLVHASLVDAWGDTHNLTESYAWRWYAYHLVQGGRLTELSALLLDPAWLQAKLAATDVTSLTSDFDYLSSEEDLGLVQGAIRLSAHVLIKDPGQFSSQMIGRLLTYVDRPTIKRFTDSVAKAAAATQWLRPLQPALDPPGTGLTRTLAGHTDVVTAVALTGDGKQALSASRDQTLKVWDLESGRQLRSLAGHTSRVTSVALSGDGRRAVSASDDNTLKVWDLESGRQLRSLAGHTSRVTSVALSGDGRRAVSASDDNTLKVWEVESGRELRTLAGHTECVNAVAVTGDGKLAVSASYDQTLKVWELASGRELRTLAGHTRGVYGVALTGDGKVAISASSDHTLKVWDLASGRQLRSLTGHTRAVNAVAVTGDGKLAVSASHDQTLKVWELASGRELRTLAGHTRGVYGVALTGDGKVAISASSDHTLKVWDLASGRQLRSLTGHTRAVSAMAVTGDGKVAVSAAFDRTLKVWDLESGRQLRSLAGHTGEVTAVALTRDGKVAVSASYDQTLKVWELASGRWPRTFTGHTSWVTAVAVTGDGKVAVSASWDQTLKVWDLESGRQLRTLTGHTSWVTAVALTADGKLVVSASRDRTLKVWDLESGRELRTLAGHTDGVTAVTVTGKVAVSASEDQTLKMWDLESGRELRTLAGHTECVNAVALTEDGKLAVSASRDDTVKVWELESGLILATFTCDGAAQCCAFVNDRKLIVAGDQGGRVHFLRLEEPKAKN